MKTVATHDLSFHADDVFAVAALELALGELRIVRTRDESLIENADIVVDVGRQYDPSRMRFDHHQEDGAGIGPSGIPYASFGLVWKEFGENISGSVEIAAIVERRLVAPVDANDNGIMLSTPRNSQVGDYSLASVIGTLNPTSIEKDVSADDVFPEAVALASRIIGREIIAAKVLLEAKGAFSDSVVKSVDPRLVILDQDISRYTWQQFVSEFPDLLFVVSPRGSSFAIRAIKKDYFSFENRKDLPLAWAGKSGKELEDVTGVEGAVFCHNKRFIATASTKEAILKLADIALAGDDY